MANRVGLLAKVSPVIGSCSGQSKSLTLHLLDARSRSYAEHVKILYLAITGASDPTRASIPLHIAANGSVEAGQECAVVLAGDATELVSRGTAERVEGVGVPPVKELFQKLLDHQVPIYV
jgi:hypothetical protein